MNIFILDQDPVLCAEYHCDKHVVKMIVETAQLLCTAHHVNGANPAIADLLYKKTHENHPCAIWARKSKENYDWLCQLGLQLCLEYTHRYDKTHKTESLLEDLAIARPSYFYMRAMTPFALAMPDEYKHSNPVIAYRMYYKFEKKSIATYKNRDVPPFML